MSKDVWLSVEEVCKLTSEVKETVRRKCKRGDYTSTFKKEGKFKTYSILLESLPESIKNKCKETLRLRILRHKMRMFSNC